MSCAIWHESLIEKLYGEIDEADDARLTAHLAECTSCRERLGEFQRVRSLMQEDDLEARRVPRVVVLRPRARFRPALLAAALAGTAILAGAGAGAGYALGVGNSRAEQPPSAVQAASTEEIVRREVERRIAEMKESPSLASSSTPEGPVPTSAADRPISQSELRAELAKFERKWNGARAADMDYVLDQIASAEFRVGTSLGKTNQALRTVALASTPYANEQ
jgi:hypothetical protein